MNRPDFVTLHMNARRHRSRLIGDLFARLVRRIRLARIARVRPASVAVR